MDNNTHPPVPMRGCKGIALPELASTCVIHGCVFCSNHYTRAGQDSELPQRRQELLNGDRVAEALLRVHVGRSRYRRALNGLICFSLLAAAAWVFTRFFIRTSRRWAISSAALGMLVPLLFVATQVSFVRAESGLPAGAPAGLLQRITIVAGWCWVSLLCWRLRRQGLATLPGNARLAGASGAVHG